MSPQKKKLLNAIRNIRKNNHSRINRSDGSCICLSKWVYVLWGFNVMGICMQRLYIQRVRGVRDLNFLSYYNKDFFVYDIRNHNTQWSLPMLCVFFWLPFLPNIVYPTNINEQNCATIVKGYSEQKKKAICSPSSMRPNNTNQLRDKWQIYPTHMKNGPLRNFKWWNLYKSMANPSNKILYKKTVNIIEYVFIQFLNMNSINNTKCFHNYMRIDCAWCPEIELP